MLRRPRKLRVAMATSEDDVARFEDDQQVYALLGGMFQDMLADESAGPRLRAIGGTVQWQLRRPSARITVRLGEGVEPGVDFGETSARPEVVLSLDAETAHRFWAGELPMHVALSQGLIRAKGPVATILRVVPAVGPAREFYAARLAGGGTVVVASEEGAADGEAAAVDEPVAPAEGAADDATAAPEEPAAEAPEAAAEPEVVEEAAAGEPEAAAVEPAAPAEEPVAEAETAAVAEPAVEEPVAVPEVPVVDEPVVEEPAASPEEPAAAEEAPAEEPAPVEPPDDAPAS
jgi:hypothetical protein